MTKNTIDLNADVGEGVNNEAQLMPFLSSCNIACGGHAGDLTTMTTVVQLAKKHQVKIGAHPSFPDKENFGRLQMDISSADLMVSLKTQVDSLLKVVDTQNCSLHHIKPHGALYNLANTDKAYAEVIIDLMNHYKSRKLYAPYGSLVAKMAQEANITVVYEAFADRNYNDDLTLVSRSKPNALIEDTGQMSAHVINMILHQYVTTVNGTKKHIKGDTICMHGDHPQAQNQLQFLTEQLTKKGIQIL